MSKITNKCLDWFLWRQAKKNSFWGLDKVINITLGFFSLIFCFFFVPLPAAFVHFFSTETSRKEVIEKINSFLIMFDF